MPALPSGSGNIDINQEMFLVTPPANRSSSIDPPRSVREVEPSR
jgi:hypothetical protein